MLALLAPLKPAPARGKERMCARVAARAKLLIS